MNATDDSTLDAPELDAQARASLAAFTTALAYPLDEFQLDACAVLASGRSVLVCAPTGAGKTIVGEFAVHQALQAGTKCFYTTPIKALSNQKYNDLCREYGSDTIGLLTGDQSINSQADIVVMTTEVLRNMIYAGSDTLHGLSHVVMDEVHFLADRFRGGVWEEVILNLPPEVLLASLSATVSNAEEFGAWLTEVRGDSVTIVSEHRPVPLYQHLLVGSEIVDLFDQGKPGQLGSRARRVIGRYEQRQGPGFQARMSRGGSGGGFRSRSGARESESGSSFDSPPPPPTSLMRRADLIAELGRRGLLPAITFIFSRAGCDKAVFQCLRSQLVLTTQEEAQRIAAIVDHHVAEISDEDREVLGYRPWRAALLRGFAAHHAGLLPAFRHCVEELFVLGLVKAVFATETLALGINMPAKAVVLERLVKFNGESHVDLTPGEFTQLTGRAGRRGIDVEGHAVITFQAGMDAEAIAGLASTRTYPLRSSFSPSYNMSINLLRRLGQQEGRGLLEKSFAQYQTDKHVVSVVRTAERTEREYERARADLVRLITASVQQVPVTAPSQALADGRAETLPDGTVVSSDPGLIVENFSDYLAISRALTEAERNWERQRRVETTQELKKQLGRLQRGEVIALYGRGGLRRAVVIAAAADARDPRPQVIDESGWAGRIDPGYFTVAPPVLGTLRLPPGGEKQLRTQRKRIARELATSSIRTPRKAPKGPRFNPAKVPEIAALRAKLRAHPAHHWPQRDHLAGLGSTVTQLRSRAAAQRETVAKQADTLGRTFDRVLLLLGEYGYVQRVDETPAEHDRATPVPVDGEVELVVTGDGERLARIYSESDLLVAECLRRGIYDDLDPAELAAAVSVSVFETRRDRSSRTDLPTDALSRAVASTLRIHQEIIADEQRHQLPLTREPDQGFATAIHQWTAGAPLEYALAAAEASGAELSPGDFVRWCRQVIDALDQVAQVGYSDAIRGRARSARDAIRRGVVALGA